MKAPIVFLTDFGTQDWYVAAMKGVALGVAPESPLVDLTHEVKPGEIEAAAFVLEQCWRDFPEGTVFVAVVDPGVGSARAALAVRAEGRHFVGPDNGLFSFLPDGAEVRRVENAALLRPGVSRTFHGRDVFAPVGAALAAGTAFEAVGPEHGEWLRLALPKPAFEERRAQGQVVFVDRFGNLITNLPVGEIVARYGEPGPRAAVACGVHAFPFADTYAGVAEGSLLAYGGSGGYVELAVNRGDAAKMYGLGVGEPVMYLPG